nr:MAG TPA: hypothetical protein [Bacteriophage sp.]
MAARAVIMSIDMRNTSFLKGLYHAAGKRTSH